jgi:hypothetical protein
LFEVLENRFKGVESGVLVFGAGLPIAVLAATALATPAIPVKAFYFYCPIGFIGACCQQYKIHTDEGKSCTSPFLHFAALSDENQANMHCNYIVSRSQRPRNGSVKATT